MKVNGVDEVNADVRGACDMNAADGVCDMKKNDEEMISALLRLLKIKSVKYDGLTAGEYTPQPGKPFGEGIAQTLEEALALCKSLGMRVKNCDGYAGYAEVGDGDEMMGILMHLDVVPEGSGWDYPPYGGEISDGRLYGRGAVDDKGPAAAAIFALKELVDEGFEFGKRVRLIFGCDEENDWECMDHYKAHEECPDFGFTPDADFPMIYGEMGILDADFVVYLPEGDTSVITAGEASNAVPAYCKAQVMTKSGVTEIIGSGVAAHASLPHEGRNAISDAMKKLADIRDTLTCSEELKSFIDFYNDKIGFALHGEKIGCGFEDAETGKLTFNAGMIRTVDGVVRMSVDMRVPVTVDKDEVIGNLQAAAAEYGVSVENTGFMDPVFSPLDSHLANVLMDVYREATGDDTEPMTMGGGTYARAMDNVVAYGPLFPGREATEHMTNEYILVEDLVKIKAIYKEAIRRLAGRE